MSDNRSVIDLAPAQRRMILVASEQKYEEIISQIDWVKVATALLFPGAATFASPAVAAILGGDLARSAYLAPTFASSGRSDGLLDRVGSAFRKGHIPLPRLTPEEAGRAFHFENREPHDGTVYLLHPVLEERYLLPSSANGAILKDHFAATTRILASLGARRIDLTAVNSSAEKAGGRAKVPLTDPPVDLGFSAEFGSDGQVKRTTVREYDQPRHAAKSLPPELLPWLGFDEQLAAVVSERISNGLSRATFTLNTEEKMDIGIDALIEVEKRGVRVGSSYSNVSHSVWRFEVHFWPYS